MKTIETSKGKFFVFNSKGEDFDGFKHNNTYYYKGRIIKLSEITEDQASEIVVKHEFTPTYKEELIRKYRTLENTSRSNNSSNQKSKRYLQCKNELTHLKN